jgi:tRNA-binding protein
VPRRSSSETNVAEITFDDFQMVDIRVGTVVAVEPYPEARKPAYKIQVDFGPELGVKKSSAQLVDVYRPEELMGRQVAAVVNFPPRQIGKFMSEILILGFPGQGGVVLIGPERPVADGGRLF